MAFPGNIECGCPARKTNAHEKGCIEGERLQVEDRVAKECEQEGSPIIAHYISQLMLSVVHLQEEVKRIEKRIDELR